MESVALNQRRRFHVLALVIGALSGLSAVAFYQSIHWAEENWIHRIKDLPGWLGIVGLITLPALGGRFGGILVEALGFGSGGQWNSSDEGGLLFEIRPYSVSDGDQQIYFGNDINRHRRKSRPGRPDGTPFGGIGFVRRSLVRLGSEAGDGVDSYGLLRGGRMRSIRHWPRLYSRSRK